MSGDLHLVHLKGPAKVGERWMKPGPASITAEEKVALEAAGLIEVETAAEPLDDLDATITVTKRQLLEAVAAQAKALSEAVTDAAIEAAAAAIVAERDQLKGEVAELQARLAAAEAKNQSPASAGEAGAADGSTSPPGGTAAPAAPHTPPPEKAAKTAPKKGAAATTKG